jgi:hypothetical protein
MYLSLMKQIPELSKRLPLSGWNMSLISILLLYMYNFHSSLKSVHFTVKHVLTGKQFSRRRGHWKEKLLSTVTKHNNANK